ncbi:hypothetical protein SKAU_G00364270 [Synaphobranchus kaupii]|uniref:Uncharacterized protein n=1 Tax=Synaphobranchus kaupii TaxID=118154 RepID=A0A9Q1EES4_SYNKA|nr:hypothetical protein SKAU_G00364270 [Synaphobranchus kaupii]
MLGYDSERDGRRRERRRDNDRAGGAAARGLSPKRFGGDDPVAGMIRTEQEEFFIEPLERGGHATGEEEEQGDGRRHIVYRSSAVKKPAAGLTEDFHSRGQSAPFVRSPKRAGPRLRTTPAKTS